MIRNPVLDPRTSQDIVKTAQDLRPVYTPDWTRPTDDTGIALISIFARLMEIVIDRLNRVPEKQFLSFLNTAGISLLPPKAARVPIRFLATAGAKKDGVVPAGTQVATSPPPGQEALTFETEGRLTVSRANLIALFSHDPAADRFSDHQAVIATSETNDNVIPAVPAFAGSSLIAHRLYLSQEVLFNIAHQTTVTVQFTLESVTPEIEALFTSGLRWSIGGSGVDVTPPVGNVTVAGTTIRVLLDSPLLTEVKSQIIDGIEAAWLRVETNTALSAGQAATKIVSVTATSSATAIKPVLAFYNAVPLDVSREFYPFGDRPKTFDTFFVAIPEGLSKAGSAITLQPQYAKGKAGSSEVSLKYEFWNGSIWSTLAVTNNAGAVTSAGSSGFTDSTKAFTADPGPTVKVQFTCPVIKPVEVNGKKDYWLRIRITSGHYGEDAKMELPLGAIAPFTLDKWKYTALTFKPPIVTALSVSYAYASENPVTAVKTENNFSFAPVDLSNPFQPFVTTTENQPACYLGFDSPFSSSPVDLYVAIEEAVHSAVPQVVWEYWNGTNWENLGAKDGTTHLTESGVVEFIGPTDIQKKSLFGETSYWLRARLENGDPSGIRVLGLHLNSTWAKQCVTITQEALGSSTETPKASYNLSRFPVLDGAQIEVREPERLSDEELAVLQEEEGPDAVSLVQPIEGSVRERWVRWHRVDHFLFSGKKSRHYVLDWFDGRVHFGDGIRGMVPPAGRGNIRAKWYQAGGGAKGNVPRNIVNALKRAIPFVGKAYNVDQAGGGSDGETIGHVKIRGPQAVKNRSRAVTVEDYEWLALEASLQVARARCLPARTSTDAGKVRLILVPWSLDLKPVPSQGLIRQVREHISTHIRRISTADLIIVGPSYVEIAVSAKIIPNNLTEADLVRRRVQEGLTEFFHPLRGGPDKSGWEFGRDVFVSEVSKAIEDLQGVHHAVDVGILVSVSVGGGTVTQIDIGEDYLVASGNHEIIVVAA